jgi:phosphate:Na+ symporter
MGMREIFLVTGGLGLFLFGMNMMSNGLKTVAGDRMHGILKIATSNRFLAVFVGIIATIVINSSTATTIMTVSFVNTGMMNLTQAIGIIMGANVGTTFSGQLIAFRLDTFAPFFIFIGAVVYLFFKKSSIKNIGYIILGFGVLFFGVSVMGGPFKDLAQQPGFNAILTAFSNPFLALLSGFIFTAIIQSSSATIGLLVTLHLSGVPIPFDTSAFIILGTNIGTSLTTVIASIPANRESKRAALFHIMYDIIGSAVFGTIIYVFPGILGWFVNTWHESARQVAMFHTLYNVATLFLLLPFIAYIAKLMERIVPIKEDAVDGTYEKKLLYLDSPLIITPTMAIMNAKLEIIRMAKIANEIHRLSVEAFFDNDSDKIENARKYRKTVNYLKNKIKLKLVEINGMRISRHEAERVSEMADAVTKIGKIDEHAKKIARNAKDASERNIEFSEATVKELKMLTGMTDEMLTESINLYENDDKSSSSVVKSQGKIIKSLKTTCVENHMERLKQEAYTSENTGIYISVINSLEKTAEHAKDIALSN